jgi:hypothetical protein
MANDATPAGANLMLDALVSPLKVKLHTASPTDAGTAANSVQYPTPASVAFGAAASGQRVNTAAGTWATSAGAETVTHVSIWNTAATVCVFQGPLSAPVPTNAEPFQIDIGALVLALT